MNQQQPPRINGINIQEGTPRSAYRRSLMSVIDVADGLGDNQPVLGMGIAFGNLAHYCADLDDAVHILEEYSAMKWAEGKTLTATRAKEIKQALHDVHMQLGEQLKIGAKEIAERQASDPTDD